MIDHDKLIFMGVISSAHGIKGEVIVKSLTQPKSNICKLQLVDTAENIFNLKLMRQNTNGSLICKVNNINNRNDAEKLAGSKLFCLRSTLPNPNPGEFYIEDLKGLKVVDKELNLIGKVKDICNFGAGDLIEVAFEAGTLELFPFTKEFFPEITAEYIVLKC
jgi:16S rRNA processing protein RimM